MDLVEVLEKPAGILNCHRDAIRRPGSIPSSMKGDRDLLVYLVQTHMPSNEEIGRLFGLTYRAARHFLGAMRTRLKEAPDLRAAYNRVYSLCKM